MEKLTLKKPLHTLAGEEINELSFNFDGLTARDYTKIVKLEARLKGSEPSLDISSLSKKASTEFAIATAWIAALKATPHVCFDDIDGLSFIDLMEISQLGSFFILGVSE